MLNFLETLLAPVTGLVPESLRWILHLIVLLHGAAFGLWVLMFTKDLLVNGAAPEAKEKGE